MTQLSIILKACMRNERDKTINELELNISELLGYKGAESLAMALVIILVLATATCSLVSQLYAYGVKKQGLLFENEVAYFYSLARVISIVSAVVTIIGLFYIAGKVG